MQIKILDPGVNHLPEFATDGSAAMDLRASKDVLIYPRETHDIPTGIAIWIEDPNLAGIIIPRSGLGRRGLILSNSVGLIDSDYQGELIVSMIHRNDGDCFRIDRGDRIAQLCIFSIMRPKWYQVNDFDEGTKRGDGGFGHTGLL